MSVDRSRPYGLQMMIGGELHLLDVTLRYTGDDEDGNARWQIHGPANIRWHRMSDMPSLHVALLPARAAIILLVEGDEEHGYRFAQPPNTEL